MGDLVQTIYTIVKEHPDQVGRVYTRLLRLKGFPNISKHEVNSILYGRRDLFKAKIGDNYIPAWNILENNTFTVPSQQKQTNAIVQVTPRFTAHAQSETFIIVNDHFSWESRFNLYQWQTLALNSWQDSGYRGVIEAVTGSGKTRLALAAMEAHLKLGYKILIIVPYKELMNQWSEVISEYFQSYRIGYLGDGSRQSLRFVDILIGISNSVQKYRTLPSETKALIIADEVHHYGTSASKKMLEKGYIRRLGLTASLKRNDDGVEQVIKTYFGDVSFTYDYSEAIDDKVIAPFKILFVSVAMEEHELDEYSKLSSRISKLKSSLEKKYPNILQAPTGTYNQKINRLPYMDKEVQLYKTSTYKRSRMVVSMRSKLSIVKYFKSIIKKASGTFIFTQLKETNREISAILSLEKVTVVPMDGNLLIDKRHAILEKFKKREIEAIAAPLLLDEGIDVPHADLAIITGKSNSRRQLIQRLGRVVRRKEDNGIARIIILISKDTTEDPDLYDNEAFYEVFEGADILIDRIEIDDNVEDLVDYLEEWSS